MPSDLSHYPEFWDSVFGVLLSRYHSSEIVTSLSGPPPVLVTCCAPALHIDCSFNNSRALHTWRIRQLNNVPADTLVFVQF